MTSYMAALCFCDIREHFSVVFFFFNDTATTEIYPLSLHDALPISFRPARFRPRAAPRHPIHRQDRGPGGEWGDRKSTRLNSSHANISYAVFCLKKKKKQLLHNLEQDTAPVTYIAYVITVSQALRTA